LRIDPLRFKDVVLFFPKYDIETAVTCYSILGGIPMYLNEFVDRMPLAENIRKMLAKDSILYEEPIFLLREELREPATYSAILEKIAAGSTKMNEISIKTGIEVHKLPKYLKVLENLHIIERVTPVTVSKAKSKQTLYIIKDDFFRFWYYFVFPARSEIEGGSIDVVLDQIKSRMSSFTSATFEKICREFLSESGTFNKVGRWWHKDREIDIVALNEQAKEILFAECKWQDRVDARKILADLKEKAGYVQWNNGKRKEHYVIFAKSFRDINVKGVKLFDLKDMDKVLKRPSKASESP
jgi:AAA+ ATPase superfamily predicted ATPase